MPRREQYGEESQSSISLVPLIELQPMQQRALFDRETILASLMMCSQLGRERRGESIVEKEVPQYTHSLSRLITSRSSQRGMFHRLAIREVEPPDVTRAFTRGRAEGEDVGLEGIVIFLHAEFSLTLFCYSSKSKEFDAMAKAPRNCETSILLTSGRF